MMTYRPLLAVLFAAVLSVATVEAYNGGRQWWDGAASSETAQHTSTGTFQTHTDKARERMRGEGGYVPYTPKKDEAEAKRRYNARIAATAKTSGGRWHETGGDYGGSTNGFMSHTDQSREQMRDRMMQEAQQRYLEKRQRMQEQQQQQGGGW